VIGVEIEDFYDGFSIILRDEESGVVCKSERFRSRRFSVWTCRRIQSTRH